MASPFTHGTNSLPIWRLLRSECACGMRVCAGLVGTCSHVTKASKTSQEAPGICPFLPPCCRDYRCAPGFSFYRGVEDPNSCPHVYRASVSLTEPPSSLQEHTVSIYETALCQALWGVAKGPSLRPLSLCLCGGQGSTMLGNRYNWISIVFPSLNTQNRSALVEDGTLNPHAPQLPFPTVGSLDTIQRDSTT